VDLDRRRHRGRRGPLVAVASAPLRPGARLFKQTLGWATPKIRTSAAADRWTWLVIAAPQLRLARPVVDLRRPGNGPTPDRRILSTHRPKKAKSTGWPGWAHVRTNSTDKTTR
jgi:hypothetical protein